jgi:predicted nucleic acid-binding protein
LSFDLNDCLRRLKPQKRTKALSRRDDADLIFIDKVTLTGPDILVDTSVVIDILQGRAPNRLDEVLTARTAHYSTVVLSELTHLFGRLDPGHVETAAALKSLRAAIDAIPQHRLITPTAEASAEAGIMAGVIARLTGRKDQALLNDALIYCQAAAQGLTILTGNISDFDLLNQLKRGNVLFYRK